MINIDDFAVIYHVCRRIQYKNNSTTPHFSFSDFSNRCNSAIKRVNPHKTHLFVFFFFFIFALVQLCNACKIYEIPFYVPSFGLNIFLCLFICFFLLILSSPHICNGVSSIEHSLHSFSIDVSITITCTIYFTLHWDDRCWDDDYRCAQIRFWKTIILLWAERRTHTDATNFIYCSNAMPMGIQAMNDSGGNA